MIYDVGPRLAELSSVQNTAREGTKLETRVSLTDKRLKYDQGAKLKSINTFNVLCVHHKIPTKAKSAYQLNLSFSIDKQYWIGMWVGTKNFWRGIKFLRIKYLYRC